MSQDELDHCKVSERQSPKQQDSSDIDISHAVTCSGDPHRAEAERFLSLLDKTATEFTFQVFDDNKDRRDSSLAHVLNGTLERHWTTLVRLNTRGAGIFVTVNATDLTGRTRENITRIRALWQEADRGDEPDLPIQPHIVVESSPGKYHRYILVEGAPLDGFAAVQQRMVDSYGSDPNAKDIARVLRLPGFDHMKDSGHPHRVRIVQASENPPIPWGQVLEILPPVERAQPSETAELPDAGAPLQKPADIVSALDALTPDLGYQDWLKVGMALHSTGAGQDALDIWDRWSQGGKLYRPGECAYRWSTFLQAGGVSLRTLFHLARAAGWTGEISVRPDMLPLIEAQRARMLEDFGQRHGVAMVNGQATVVYRERDAGTGRMTTRFSRPNDINLKYRPDKLPSVKGGSGGQTVEYKTLADVWLQWPNRRTYDQLVFRPVPRLVAGDTALPDGKTLNLYQGLAIQPAPGDCRPILDHIRNIWCSGHEAAFAYVMGWLARLFQCPNERGHAVIVLKSGEGTGKNIIVDILVRAFGEHATVAVKPDDLTGRFNDHLGTSVLVFANEAVWGGSKDQEGVLKSLITDEELPVERKYLPKYRVRNCCHLIMASNNDWVAPVGLDDRRFLILDLNEDKKGDHDYFNALAAHIGSGGQEAFIDHLLSYDIGSYDPRQLPDLGLDQATKRDAKIRGADTVTKWWLHCLETGEILLTGAFELADGEWMTSPTRSVGSRDIAKAWERGPIQIPKQTLFDAYGEWTHKSRLHTEHLTTLAKKLKELAKVGDTRPRPSAGGNRLRVFVIPRLSDCRKHFEVKAKMPWDWGADDDLEDELESLESEILTDEDAATDMPGSRLVTAAQRRAQWQGEARAT